MGPFAFSENRVWRCYLGGKMIDLLRGNPEGDDTHFPEDWIASVVEALNPQRNVEGEGISTAVVDGDRVPFTELAESRAPELFGADHVARHGRTPGFLAKLLDSAIRLPLQAHPDREAARRIYGSEYGKTEAWIVLATRRIADEDPYLLLGFNRSLDRETFVADSLRGDVTRPVGMVHRHPVKAGDVLLLTGGLVHAIGPGVFLVEIMEPSDWVTQPDAFCGEQPLTLQDRFGPVKPERAMEVFHFDPVTRDDAWASAALTPRLLQEQEGSSLWSLIGSEDTPYFGARRLDLRGEWRDAAGRPSFYAGVVVDGSVTLVSAGRKLPVRAGGTFFVPHSSDDVVYRGEGAVIQALPPGSPPAPAGVRPEA